MKWWVIELEAIATGLPCKNKAWSLYVTEVTFIYSIISPRSISPRDFPLSVFVNACTGKSNGTALSWNYSNQISAFLTVWAQWGLARQKLEMQAIASEN